MRWHKGFSLLEILIAFAIMAVALTIVLRIFGSGVTAAAISEDYTVAVQIGESLMARTGVETPLLAGESSGIEADKYQWQVLVTPVMLPAAPPSRFSQQPNSELPPEQLMSVKVRVSWDDGNQEQRQLELNSLKLMQPSPAS